MLYGHQTFTKVPSGISNLEKLASTSLPSFNELLTSIPLPNEFRSRQSSVASSYDSSPQHPATISVPYSQTTPRLRMVQYSPSSISHASPNPPQQFMQPYAAYSYQTYMPAGYHSPWGGSINGAPPSQHIIATTMTSPTTLNGTTAFDNKIRSHSTSDLVMTGNGILVKDSKRKHVCKVCSRSFTTSGHLARHNRIHTGERKHVCPWPTCDTRFARQDNCMQHYKTHTNGKNKRSRTSKLSTKSFS
ncbi:uncharacterized protein SPAPADRAFT_63801 [Spathaspora passalidarum NRRL Y-27907]|uniref:C2H2-type domain-containing protein n=1 Tax=Spathaspora passalidarum (strain NRRL Y-27907 / 11-Y1) TaxID=619300 RepID=G3AVM3_SPAPN|nr:uncharacterized protein SPAPADRAFT_63801 [Spathaspora passalidarum NRRL Y-27907]EGW30188.1 hypothetical protein SPAPADRAFT_63801 [Spathaspora passalidarum NRRL Y-27907]